jgi:hypothetical protein
MRRMRLAVFAATAVVALVVVGVALAASLNSYNATITSKQNGPGTAKKPVAMGFVQKLAAKNVSGNTAPNAAPLIDIKVTLPKVKFNTKGFPVCSAATIAKAGTDAGCPKGALFASGPVTGQLYAPKSATNPTVGTPVPCDPVLDSWNAGNGKVTNFFKIPAGHQCSGLVTGSVAPWVGSLKESGTTLTYDTPLPPPVSTNAGNLGVYSALVAETITFNKLTTKVGGKLVPFFESVGCVAGKRPYTVTFTATDGATKQVSTVTGKSAC